MQWWIRCWTKPTLQVQRLLLHVSTLLLYMKRFITINVITWHMSQQRSYMCRGNGLSSFHNLQKNHTSFGSLHSPGYTWGSVNSFLQPQGGFQQPTKAVCQRTQKIRVSWSPHASTSKNVHGQKHVQMPMLQTSTSTKKTVLCFWVVHRVYPTPTRPLNFCEAFMKREWTRPPHFRLYDLISNFNIVHHLTWTSIRNKIIGVGTCTQLPCRFRPLMRIGCHHSNDMMCEVILSLCMHKIPYLHHVTEPVLPTCRW